MKTIDLLYKGKEYQVPNSWEAVTPDIFMKIVENLHKMSLGEFPPAMFRIHLLCDLMGWNLAKFTKENAIQNLLILSEQITFIFKISYPDNDKALEGLSDQDRSLCKRIIPERLQLPIGKYLATLDYQFVIDLCFCQQMVPFVNIGLRKYKSYSIDTGFSTLTTSLSTLQYIEARDLITQGDETLPLLAAILYYPGRYSSQGAHRLAEKFVNVDKSILLAISLNFQAFNSFLFTKTHFDILTASELKKPSAISTDAEDALYELSADGLGDNSEIEQMNLLKYLRILRKKLISSVKSLHEMKMDITEISTKTGLPIHIINKII